MGGAGGARLDSVPAGPHPDVELEELEGQGPGSGGEPGVCLVPAGPNVEPELDGQGTGLGGGPGARLVPAGLNVDPELELKVQGPGSGGGPGPVVHLVPASSANVELEGPEVDK